MMKTQTNNSNVAMFLDDISSNYSIFFTPVFNKLHKPYTIYDNHHLKELFDHSDPLYFSYHFDELLGRITREMVTSGKAFLEIIESKNDDDKLIGISFKLLDPLKIKSRRNHYLLREKTNNTECREKAISKDNIIIFKLSDIDLSKRKLKKIMKKMGKVQLPNIDLISNTSENGFDYEKFMEKYQFKNLSICKDFSWYFRNDNNPLLSECYLLYRIAKFAELRREFFEYILEKINGGLASVGMKNGFSGKIKECWNFIDYEKCLDSLYLGEYDISQAISIIIHKKDAL